MRRKVFILIILTVSSLTVWAQKEPADYVNTAVGASTSTEEAGCYHGLGKTFPGAATPFGLVQLSPDTKTGGDNGPGYSWHQNTIEGFSFTHMSGIGWYGDLGNFLVMPTTGKLFTAKGSEEHPETGYRSRYSHKDEITKAGYYAVTLDDYGIRVELTAAPRSGILRFTYPEAKDARIQIDLARRIGGTSTEQYVEVLDDHTIQGWMKCTPEGGGWGNGDGKGNYTVYFYCQVSKPLKQYGVWSAKIPDGTERKNQLNDDPAYQKMIAEAEILPMRRKAEGKHLGFYTEFETGAGEEVLLKSGISFVSIEGARLNLEQDIKGWDFDKVRKNSRKSWNEALSGVKISGGSEREKTVFYTALYHTMIDPRCYSDSNQEYIGADGKKHKADGFTYRTIFSGWDVFRSQFPLQALINPRLVNDEINSLIQIAELSGNRYFPRWEFLNSFSGCMLGNPAVSVVADAYEKGIREYDVDKALAFCEKTVQNSGNGERGYVPGDLSRTLEYAYSDWCMGRFFESRGNKEKAALYYKKSKDYKNIWNPEVKWFRARIDENNWLEWKGKTEQGQGCCECNPFQQGWFVPHDIAGMKELMGEQFFLQELETFFDKVPHNFFWNDYYNHPNEPNHHAPFLFNYTEKPWLTQKWTRAICDRAYGDDVMGLCGNEDVGQMSAWYVLAAMGIHPVCPGNPCYEITSPVFDKVELTLDNDFYPGKKFTIVAKDNSPENIYIQSVILNGKKLDRLWIKHDEIIRGGKLEFQMGAQPNTGLKGNH